MGSAVAAATDVEEETGAAAAWATEGV